MNVSIDESGCIGCGLCTQVCPEVFEMNDSGVAEVIMEEIPENLEDSVQEAADGCPVEVITVE
ncbi:ferredoxin [Eubacterium sp. 1001713B170207_170306_E7]|uniref:ferredoxin n=1 Tax=Eubacterium sp. 1001713B170207_170306_E7 TaxID=2787097 RepID=UPI00189A61FA|nr:ferredoxin [Eubacterium sp. 1001713B170207_170306_E7]